MANELSLLAPDLPFALQVEITSHCNLHCKMCPLTTEQTASGITPGHITDLLWDDVVDLAKRVRQVVVAGFGEPLTNRRCLQLLEQLNELGVHMSLVTNGTALTPDHARRLAALQYLAQINISIDSPDPAVYFEVRGGHGAASTSSSGGAAGGLIGALTGLGIPENEAKFYHGELSKGGILLGVYAHQDRIKLAKEILDNAGAEKTRG